MSARTLLIVPCYNEEQRLDLNEFKKYSDKISFLFANDGSSDNTQKIIESIADDDSFYVYNAKENQGKALVIYGAYCHSQDKGFLNKYDWIGYWDADLATPLWEVQNMLELAEKDQIDSVWGSRVARLGSRIERSLIRHYLGRVFATLSSVVLGVNSYDSQCGAKLFKKETAQEAFAEKFITNWIFDIEIQIKLKNSKIVEYPLIQWTDIPGSKVNFTKDLPRVLGDLYKLWKKYKK